MNEKKSVIALGFFDGVHLGHQALLRTAVARAEQFQFSSAVFTFDRSPKEFVTGHKVPRLTTNDERKATMQQLFPIDTVIIEPFDEQMMTMPWVDFVLLLAQKYRAGWLVAGHDFRFGHKNAGTPALLCKKAAQLGMGCDIIPAVTLDGVTVSSTHIRQLLRDGEVEQARQFLGHAYTITGEVRHGKGLGQGTHHRCADSEYYPRGWSADSCVRRVCHEGAYRWTTVRCRDQCWGTANRG